jgi:hypothetical protein
VLDQRIHHPRSTRQKFVTVNAAAASLNPVADKSCDTLIQAGMRALARAKADREGRVAIAPAEGII